MRKIVQAIAVTGVAATILAPTAAQAAPEAGSTTAYLGTYGFGRAGVIGAEGRANGLWTGSWVRSGFAGDDLLVTYTPRTTARAAEQIVYTAAFDAVADPRGECRKVGAEGVARKVWVSFRCRTGFAPSYTLLVR
ncbi:hypothetical protein ACWKSP_20925 [Micromonosporaceae bacterium Da 78-11]